MPETPCDTHRDTEAARVCAECGAKKCAACADKDAVMRFYIEQGAAQCFCSRCGFRDVSDTIAERSRETDEAAARQARSREGATRRKRLAVLVACLVLVGALALVVHLRRRPPVEGTFAFGAGLAQDPEVQSCLDALWRVGAAVEAYRAAEGSYPTALTALVPAHLEAVPGLPHGSLRYSSDGRTWFLDCDRPQDYGLGGIFSSSRGVIPTVLPGVPAPQ